MRRFAHRSSIASATAGPSRSSTPTTRIRATLTGRCSECRCSISATLPASWRRSANAAVRFRVTTSRSTRSMPRADANRCVFRSSSTARGTSPALRSFARRARAAACAIRHAPMPRTSPKARVTGAERTPHMPDDSVTATLDLDALYRDSHVGEALETLDRELVGLEPVKTRVREIAALLLVERLRRTVGLEAGVPSLHMSFTGNPGTGKTTVALRMAALLHSLGYVRKGHLVAVTRDDLVGQYIGHTAPKTREMLKKAMGGVLFIDEAYYLYRPENERDYGQEAIEILLQVMENQRDDLVVILAGYKNRMDTFFASNPGMASRIAHHIDFPDYSEAELMQITQLMLTRLNYHFDAAAEPAFARYVALRRQQPHFANARSIRNALDRIRLRHATRLFASSDPLSREQLTTLQAEDILASRVFGAASDAMAQKETS